MELIQQFDWSVLHWIQDNLSCGFMDVAMKIFTILGNAGILWLGAAFIMLFFKSYRRCGIHILFVSAMGLLVVNLIIKNLVARDRPCWLEPEFVLLVAEPHDFSFPSGHSFQSFASATAIFIHHKKLGIGALCIAALIAFSRLYLYVHFPTDVICGTLIGIVLAVICWLIMEKPAPVKRLLDKACSIDVRELIRKKKAG